MKEYSVIYVRSASVATVVQAKSPQTAATKAAAEFSFPHLCHKCAQAVDIGDTYRTEVREDGELVYIDPEKAKYVPTLELRDGQWGFGQPEHPIAPCAVVMYSSDPLDADTVRWGWFVDNIRFGGALTLRAALERAEAAYNSRKGGVQR